MPEQRPARILAVGFSRWKAMNLKPLLLRLTDRLLFVPSARAAVRHGPGPEDWLLCWGSGPPAETRLLADACGAVLMHMEDGFIRSVGLGSDLIPPRSIVLDSAGLYFDATRPSGLERILAQTRFSGEELARARAVAARIVADGITKYNLEPRTPPRWPSAGRTVVLVPGQVEDDASIRLGGGAVRTNLALLRAARAEAPDAFIVYKPHPDVLSRNRRGALALAEARALADHVEATASVVSCIEASDSVHVMTSLAGFDALLRGRRVVTHGYPFYAGWGLTEDRAPPEGAFARRQRKLSLEELVAGTLLRYPLYFDSTVGDYVDCERILELVATERAELELSGRLARLNRGFAYRQLRKLAVLLRAWKSGVGR